MKYPKTRVCTQCSKRKKLEYFARQLSGKYEKHSACKECINKFRRENKLKYDITRKKYRKNNIEKIREYDRLVKLRPGFKEKKAKWDKNYREKNKEDLQVRKKKYYDKNKEIILARHREKYANDPEVRKKSALLGKRNYLKNPQAAKDRSKKHKQKKRKEDPRYRINEQISKSIRRSLKLKRPGAHWEDFMPFNLNQLMKRLKDNFEKGMSFANYGDWQIDHIVPLTHFKFDSVYDEGFKKAWSLKNLQPMWAFENQSKSNRYKGKFNKKLQRQQK